MYRMLSGSIPLQTETLQNRHEVSKRRLYSIISDGIQQMFCKVKTAVGAVRTFTLSKNI
jgi:hypothetical protein